MQNSIPFTYLIGWSKQNVFYYGSRYARLCRPEQLWTTYFTSSKYVAEARKAFGEPDIIQVRRLFTLPMKARLWECKVLRRMKVRKDTRFLNKTDVMGPSTAGVKFSPERLVRHALQKTGAGNGMYGRKHKPTSTQKMRATKAARPITPEMHERISAAQRGENHPMWQKKQKRHVVEAMRLSNLGVPKTAGHRASIGASKKGKSWWQNGTTSKLSFESPGDGWQRGFLKKTNSPP